MKAQKFVVNSLFKIQIKRLKNLLMMTLCRKRLNFTNFNLFINLLVFCSVLFLSILGIIITIVSSYLSYIAACKTILIKQKFFIYVVAPNC